MNSSIEPHTISSHVFSELARGQGGQEAATLLAALQRSRQLLIVRGMVDAAADRHHPDADLAVEGYRLLREIDSVDPVAVQTVLQHPSVRSWALRTMTALDAGRPADAEAGRLAAVAAAAAVHAGLPCTIQVRARPVPGSAAEVHLPTLGRADAPDPPPGGRLDLRHEAGTVYLAGHRSTLVFEPLADDADDTAGWAALRVLTATAAGSTLRLRVDDLDPDRFVAGVAVAEHQPKRALEGWQTALEQAWNLLTAHHPVTAAEVAILVTSLTPLRDTEADEMSATSRAVPGVIALTTPRDGVSLALTLAHEIQHVKLAALMDLCELVRAESGPCYYAPWRDDPRPAHSLLQGAYAHLGIAGFWLRQSRLAQNPAESLAAQSEFVRWRDAVESVMSGLLDAAELVGHGPRFAEGMIEQLRAWGDEPVQARAVTAAREAAEAHRAEWERQHGSEIPEKYRPSTSRGYPDTISARNDLVLMGKGR